MTQAATISKTGLKETGINELWNRRLTVLKIIKTLLMRPLHDRSPDDCQHRPWYSACTPSLCQYTLRFPFKSSCPLISSGELAFGVCPPLLVAGLQNKVNFPFYQHLPLKYWLWSGKQPDLNFINSPICLTIFLARKQAPRIWSSRKNLLGQGVRQRPTV